MSEYQVYSPSRGFLANTATVQWTTTESNAYTCEQAEAEELATWHWVRGVLDVVARDALAGRAK